MADDDVQRLAINIEVRLANLEKQMAKVSKTVSDTMTGVGKNTDAAMRRMEASSTRASKALNQAFGGLKGQLLSSVSGLNGQAGLLANTLGNLGPAGATAAIGLGSLVAVFGLLYTKGKQALSAADDIGDAAAKLGVSAESLQELRAVFNGLVDPAQVDAGLGKLTEQIGLASAGVPKAAKVFKALGINLRDSNGNVKEGLPVYLELADKIAALKSPAQQAAAAQKLLGDSGREMLPVLRQGSAAIKESIERYRALGAIIPEDVITKAGALQQQLDDLSLVIRAQLTTALVAVGPQIVQFTQWLASNLPQAIQIATKVLKFLADNLKTIVTLLGGVAGFQIGGLLGSALGPLGAVVGALAGGLAGIVGTAGAVDQMASSLDGAGRAAAGAAGRLDANTQALQDNKTAAEDAAQSQKRLADEAEAAAKRAADARRAAGQLPEGTSQADVRMNADRQDMQRLASRAFGVGSEPSAVDVARQSLDEALALRKEFNDQILRTMIDLQEKTGSAESVGKIDDFVQSILAINDKGGPALEAFKNHAATALADLEESVGDTDGKFQGLILRLLDIGLKLHALDGQIATIQVNLVTQRLEEQLPKGPAYGDVPPIGADEFILGSHVTPGQRPPPPPPRRTGGTGELGSLGKGGGGGAAKAPKDPKLPEYLKQLQTEVDRLALSGIALKENQLRTEALTKAKEDFKNKLRASADLTTEETATIAAQAKVLAGVPDILKLAADKLPQFNLATQLKQLAELQALLADPKVIAALEAQGLSAEDAGRAIRAQIAEVKAQADGTTEAITGIGEAFQNGIQGATSFADAVTKIGIALAQMLIQAAAFGNTKAGGPLGGLFDSLAGTIGGLAGMFGGGAGTGGTPLGLGGIGHAAGGADLGAGQPSIINELGREAASRGGDLFIPGKAATIMPADATRRAMGGAANSNAQPITFNISMAGANGDRAILAIAARAVKEGLKSVPEINRQHAIRFAG